jgi:hypothetical protein
VVAPALNIGGHNLYRVFASDKSEEVGHRPTVSAAGRIRDRPVNKGSGTPRVKLFQSDVSLGKNFQI